MKKSLQNLFGFPYASAVCVCRPLAFSVPCYSMYVPLLVKYDKNLVTLNSLVMLVKRYLKETKFTSLALPFLAN